MARLIGKLPGSGYVQQIRPYLPPLNFITVHHLYFFGTCIVTSVIFYCTSTPAWSISYTDSLFLVVSAMTEVSQQYLIEFDVTDADLGWPQYGEPQYNEYLSTMASVHAHLAWQQYIRQYLRRTGQEEGV
jgi:hypothetical protein